MINTNFNSMMNRIHEWSEPKYHPLKQIGLTRLAGLACFGLENLKLGSEIWDSSKKFFDTVTAMTQTTIHLFFPYSQPQYDPKQLPDNYKIYKQSFNNVCKRILGIFSTIIFGMIISPELNFSYHVKLGLVKDNIDIQKLRQQKANEEIAHNVAIVNRQRAADSAIRESNRQQIQEEIETENAIDTRLAELLIS